MGNSCWTAKPVLSLRKNTKDTDNIVEAVIRSGKTGVGSWIQITLGYPKLQLKVKVIQLSCQTRLARYLAEDRADAPGLGSFLESCSEGSGSSSAMTWGYAALEKC